MPTDIQATTTDTWPEEDSTHDPDHHCTRPSHPRCEHGYGGGRVGPGYGCPWCSVGGKYNLGVW